MKSQIRWVLSVVAILFFLSYLFPRKTSVILKSTRPGSSLVDPLSNSVGSLSTTLPSSVSSCDGNKKAPTCFVTNLCVSYEYGVFMTVPDGTNVEEFSKSLEKAALINIYHAVDKFWAPDVRTQSEVKKLIAGGAHLQLVDKPLLVKMPIWYHHVAHFVKDMLAPAYSTNISLNSEGQIPALLIIETPYFVDSEPAYPLDVFFGIGMIHYDYYGQIAQKWRGAYDTLPTDITCFSTAQLGAPHNPFKPTACKRMQEIGWRWAKATKPPTSRNILLIRRHYTRVWYNLDECAEVLRVRYPRHTVTVAELEYVSKQEQIRLFYEADLVIAVHGNSLGNLVWMRPGAHALELMQFGWTAGNYFKEFSEPCGVNHLIWQCPTRECQDPTSHARNQVTPKSFGILMNPTVLLELIKDML